MRTRTPPTPAKPTPPEEKKRGTDWWLLKDKLLFALGAAVTLATFVWGEVLRHGTHIEWLGFALTLFGIGVASQLDRRNRG